MCVYVCVWPRPPRPSPCPASPGRAALPGCYLSGLRSTMPITKIFFPGLIPPLMCPQKGTIWKGQGGVGEGQLGISCAAGGRGEKGLKKKKRNKRINTPPPKPQKKGDLPGEESTHLLAPGIPGSCLNARPLFSAGKRAER